MLFRRLLYITEAKRILSGNRKQLMIATAVMLALSLCINFVRCWALESVGLNFFVEILTGALSAIVMFAYLSFLVEAQKTSALDIKIPWTVFIDRFDRFAAGILSFLWYVLWCTLWCCLFFIPGIIKAFAYSQMFFILAENPSVPVRKAMRMSIAMTGGHKGDLFCLSISFIGWILLGVVTCGIGFIWITPYMSLTFHQYYRALRKNAIDCNILQPEDFDMQIESDRGGTYADSDGSHADLTAAAGDTATNATEDNATENTAADDSAADNNAESKEEQ